MNFDLSSFEGDPFLLRLQRTTLGAFAIEAGQPRKHALCLMHMLLVAAEQRSTVRLLVGAFREAAWAGAVSEVFGFGLDVAVREVLKSGSDISILTWSDGRHDPVFDRLLGVFEEFRYEQSDAGRFRLEAPPEGPLERWEQPRHFAVLEGRQSSSRSTRLAWTEEPRTRGRPLLDVLSQPSTPTSGHILIDMGLHLMDADDQALAGGIAHESERLITGFEKLSTDLLKVR